MIRWNNSSSLYILSIWRNMEKNESTFLIVQIEVPELKLIRPAGQT